MSLFRGLGFRKDATRGTTPIEVRKSLAGLFSATGVMPGGPSPLLTGTAGWAYTVAGPAWFVASRGASDGVALYGNDGAAVIGTTGVGSTVPVAPGAGLQRIDIAWTRHQSAGENGDPATTVALASEPLFGVESGVAASSSPVAPVIPAGAIELGRNTMTSAATSTASAGNTITQSAPVAAVRGTVPGPWAAYTPTLVGLTLGNGSLNCAYSLVGKSLMLRINVLFGSTTAITGSVSISLPAGFVTVAVTQDIPCKVGAAGVHLVGFSDVVGSSSVVAPYQPTSTANGTMVRVGSIGYTYGSGSNISITGTLEVV